MLKSIGAIFQICHQGYIFFKPELGKDYVYFQASFVKCKYQDLSQKRAQSAVNYLIGKGIDAGRLSALGYGETQPAVTCVCSSCTESEHQANRRTTFKIVE